MIHAVNAIVLHFTCIHSGQFYSTEEVGNADLVSTHPFGTTRTFGGDFIFLLEFLSLERKCLFVLEFAVTLFSLEVQVPVFGKVLAKAKLTSLVVVRASCPARRWMVANMGCCQEGTAENH